MMKLRKTLMAAFGALFISATAQAGVLLDPYLGYGAGKTKVATLAGSAFDGTADNTLTTFGLRVGYTIPMFFFGGDYMMLTGKSKASAPLSDGDVTGNQLYLTAGAHLLMFRAYLGYAILGSVSAKGSSSESTYTGSSMKLGASFTGLPFVALNLEWVHDTYNKLKDSVSGEMSAEANSDMYYLTVSLPFDL